MLLQQDISNLECNSIRKNWISTLALVIGLPILPGKAVLAAVNLPPTATSATVTTKEDTKLSIKLVGADPEKKRLLYTLVTQPAQGAVTLSGTTATYRPAVNYNNTAEAPDSFTFKVNDGVLDSEPATVKVVVTPVNDKPVAQNSSVPASKNLATDITLVGTDADLDPLTYVPASKSKMGGTVKLKGNNIVTYTPKYNFVGADSFTFKVNDPGKLVSPLATVNINVVNNTAPIANAGSDQQVGEG
uniref:Ig-like domain-containing protein n=1 Tax=Crenothrix polyspora TaxID=360316 RepID=UPI0015C5CD38